jgi:hypothetical protein
MAPSATFVGKKLATTPKILIIALSQSYTGFGVKEAVWFKCSLNKQTTNGNDE